MIILGIETSCDDTSIALVKDGKEILSNITHAQLEDHREFQGVVPEIASREHLVNIHKVYTKALAKAEITPEKIDAIAVTAFPGLIGSLVIGVNFAKGLATALKKPLIAVNHLLGHIYSGNFFTRLDFPLISLLISGGHTALIKMNNYFDFEIIGKTIDDSCGEAFDKIAKHFGLGYPGGPVIDKLASFGNPGTYDFPLPLSNLSKYGLNFSFSGIKTAVMYFRSKYLVNNPVNQVKKEITGKNNSLTIDEIATLNKKLSESGKLQSNEKIENICASFQNTVSLSLKQKVEESLKLNPAIKTLLIAGGASANSSVRFQLSRLKAKGLEVIFPPLDLCMDNGAMIAGIAYRYYKNNKISENDLNASARFSPLKRGSGIF